MRPFRVPFPSVPFGFRFHPSLSRCYRWVMSTQSNPIASLCFGCPHKNDSSTFLYICVCVYVCVCTCMWVCVCVCLCGYAFSFHQRGVRERARRSRFGVRHARKKDKRDQHGLCFDKCKERKSKTLWAIKRFCFSLTASKPT